MLSQRLITAIEKHAAAAYPHECCGLIIRATRQRRYIPCSNSHENPSEHFMISAQARADAEDVGRCWPSFIHIRMRDRTLPPTT